jgi:hypothetical protein
MHLVISQTPSAENVSGRLTKKFFRKIANKVAKPDSNWYNRYITTTKGTNNN